MELRAYCLQLLNEPDPHVKARALLATHQSPLEASDLDVDRVFEESVDEPGRGPRPVLLAHDQIKPQALTTRQGHGALLHAVTHIERNAIDLALDVVWRFAGLPADFYRQWFRVACEEALHFSLLSEHLGLLGYAYGDFPAHDGLWDMARRTRHDALARVALVPRTLEARGLDASPAVKAKLVSIGDLRAGEILDLILRDEVGHVAVGNHWYAWLCAQQGLEPIATYRALTLQHRAPRPRGPFNLAARQAAGFLDEELVAMGILPEASLQSP